MEAHSGLSFIEVKEPSNPTSLLHEWLNEGKRYGAYSSLMNLATATQNGKVSNRTIVIKDITPSGGLVFTAQIENPQVAATILLLYPKEGKNISRQVRFEGTVKKLPQEQCQVYYEKEKLSSKIRSWICQNGGPTDWNELKSKHDELLREVVEEQKVLEMPETQVAYEIIPSEIDFYFSSEDQIADRILFRKAENAEWEYERLLA